MTDAQKKWLTWPNVLRAVSIAALIALAVADFGFDLLAKPMPKEVYLGLVAIALGVDIKAIREAMLRLLSGGKGPSNE